MMRLVIENRELQDKTKEIYHSIRKIKEKHREARKIEAIEIEKQEGQRGA